MINQLTEADRTVADGLRDLLQTRDRLSGDLDRARQGVGFERTMAAREAAMPQAAMPQAVGAGSALGQGAYPMTSPRGMRWGRMHAGTDYAAPVGTPISTTLGGKVNSSGYESGYGKWVEVELENGVKAFWAHLSEVVLKTGQRFDAGQMIAKTGNTGRGTGPHLHSGDSSVNEALSDRYTRLGGQPIAGGAGGGMAGVPDMTGAMAAQGNVDGLEQALAGVNDQIAIYEERNGKLKQLNIDEFLLRTTDALRSQTKAYQDSTKELDTRSGMLDNGFSDAQIEKAIKLNRVNDEAIERETALDKALKEGRSQTDAYTKAKEDWLRQAKMQQQRQRKKVLPSSAIQYLRNQRASATQGQALMPAFRLCRMDGLS